MLIYVEQTMKNIDNSNVKSLHNEKKVMNFIFDHNKISGIHMFRYKLPFSILPDDILCLILSFVKREKNATKIQAFWKGFRTRKHVTRFLCLRYLQEFRHYNPTLSVYLSRCRSL